MWAHSPLPISILPLLASLKKKTRAGKMAQWLRMSLLLVRGSEFGSQHSDGVTHS